MNALTQLVAITFADGTLGVMQFVLEMRDSRGSLLWSRLPTRELVDAEIARCSFDAVKLPIIGWRYCNDDEVPADRTYRDAWVDRAGKIQHDMPKARDMHRNRIRQVRGEKLAGLDGQWMRAMGQGDSARSAAVEAQRQAWRDAPADPRIEAAQTIEELKAIPTPAV